jgi:hypothetical protein
MVDRLSNATGVLGVLKHLQSSRTDLSQAETRLASGLKVQRARDDATSYLAASVMRGKGGTLNALTFGVNWMFNPNARLYFNYDFAYRDFTTNLNNNASGWITGCGTRPAFDF